MTRSFLVLAFGSLLGSTALVPPVTAWADPASATVPDASSIKPMAPAAAPAAAAPTAAPKPAASAASASTSVGAAKPAASAPPSEDAMRAQRRADRAAFFSAHIAALHAGLALRPDQQALWQPVEAAIRDVAKARAEMWTLRHRAMADKAGDRDGDGNAAAGGADQVDALRMRGEAMTTMGNAIQGLAKATAPLLAGLTAEQKNRLPELIEGLKPRRLVAQAFNVEDMGARDMGSRDWGSRDNTMRHRSNQPDGEERGRYGDGGPMFGHVRHRDEDHSGYLEGAGDPEAGMSEQHRSAPGEDAGD